MWDVYLYEAQNNKGNARAIDNKDGQNGRNEKNTMTRNNRDARNKLVFWSSAHFSSSPPMKHKKKIEKTKDSFVQSRRNKLRPQQFHSFNHFFQKDINICLL